MVASFTPSTGLLAVDGKLSPASYLLGGFVKLSGGFAFYAWFSGDNQGDFVVSLGGYHPAFNNRRIITRPCPGSGWSSRCGPLKVIGQAYFALTPEHVHGRLAPDRYVRSRAYQGLVRRGSRLPDLLGAIPLRCARLGDDRRLA